LLNEWENIPILGTTKIHQLMGAFSGKTVFITGGSRGIGLAIGLRLAKEGANVAIAAKTTEPHPKLPGTIYTAAEELTAAGGKGLPIFMDIRHEELVEAAVQQTVDAFGGIDILINNTSAINLSGTLTLPVKRFDLMYECNVRGTFLASQKCIPYLKKSSNPHILTLSPPLNFDVKWFAPHVAYSITKYGMSLCVLGMHEEFRSAGIAVNALWPKTTIATAAVNNLLGGDDLMRRSRTPEIMGDAAYYILRRNSRECTGNFFIDEDVVIAEGETNLDKYAFEPGMPLMPDFFV
jgi:citronellol/citronellal dehydrogenase